MDVHFLAVVKLALVIWTYSIMTMFCVAGNFYLLMHALIFFQQVQITFYDSGYLALRSFLVTWRLFSTPILFNFYGTWGIELLLCMFVCYVYLCWMSFLPALPHGCWNEIIFVKTCFYEKDCKGLSEQLQLSHNCLKIVKLNWNWKSPFPAWWKQSLTKCVTSCSVIFEKWIYHTATHV